MQTRIKTELVTKMMVQLSGAAQRTTQGAADLDYIFSDRLLAKHRVEGDKFVNIDRLKVKFARRPLDRVVRQPSEVLLQSVQNHERRAPLPVRRIMGD